LPHDLQAHQCIERHCPNGSRYAWEFERNGESMELEITGPLAVDDTALMIRAALDGAGLAFVFEELVADYVERGALKRVLEDWCPVKPRFCLYYPGRRQIPAPLRAFIDMARGQADGLSRSRYPGRVQLTAIKMAASRAPLDDG
jgi:DNA-binding transcriptional LysR family regulator